ncbi:MAG TPA: alpha-amylase family glycosyl hydrolase [Trueperaceae bacterium]|nr:alpha-amylase family glycosyl hydrolase [Trueperaceae bacterium]
MGGPGLAVRERLVACGLAACLLAGAAAQEVATVARPDRAAAVLAPPEHGVWYEVFVRSFADSDGDGVGDLPGLRSRLPYLAELGVTGLWLMPVHPSPSYHGYDVTDFYAVNPEYGTLEDLLLVLEDAHALGMRVLLDLVPNHTSSRHPWFQAALAGDPRYRDRYVWADEPPAWRGTRGGSAWHRADGSHYLGLFSPDMPDLNHRDPAVVRELYDVASFWLGLGFDGFRVDAIQHVVEGADGLIANAPENYDWVRAFVAHVRSVAPDAVVVGETWTEMPAIVRYHAAGLPASFDYPTWRELTGAVQRRSAADLAFALAQAEELYPAGAMRATFTGNHDQTRFATQLSLPRRDERRLRLAASLLLTLPGTPFIYYGEEVGMTDGPGAFDVEKRTPMPWEPGEGRGFTTGVPWTDPGEPVPGVTVAEQRADPDSLWWHYRRMIALRRTHPALYRGATRVLDSGERAVLALERDAGDELLYVVANLSARDVAVRPAGLPDGLTDLLTGRPFDGTVPGLALLVLGER